MGRELEKSGFPGSLPSSGRGVGCRELALGVRTPGFHPWLWEGVGSNQLERGRGGKLGARSPVSLQIGNNKNSVTNNILDAPAHSVTQRPATPWERALALGEQISNPAESPWPNPPGTEPGTTRAKRQDAPEGVKDPKLTG